MNNETLKNIEHNFHKLDPKKLFEAFHPVGIGSCVIEETIFFENGFRGFKTWIIRYSGVFIPLPSVLMIVSSLNYSRDYLILDLPKFTKEIHEQTGETFAEWMNNEEMITHDGGIRLCTAYNIVNYIINHTNGITSFEDFYGPQKLINAIYAATNGGLDIIESLYPNSKGMSESQDRRFSLRNNEQTPTASLYKSIVGIWHLNDHANGNSVRNGIQCYMDFYGIDQDTALKNLVNKYNILESNSEK
ncbi:hypothetical protein GCM10009120_44160 [Sphingobacterium siyangense subsp. cladoniae]|uniref:hypothetical protein n=1 Tax=Sphingobacterium siyangense TaxID=459529 RepID=UPI0031FA2987